ncbi:MAG: hypothetical protein IJZ37_06950 [Clostridia bacterium]|nr:hypothetical protein [Clostridia bacterium]MBQ8399867.1 hypothetical protein [Clostridia bacterium]
MDRPQDPRQMGAPLGEVPIMPTKRPVIGREQVQKATQTLLDYKRGKSNLDRKIVENEKWYKLRHWECMRAEDDPVKPASAWLFNCLANKHADAMDNYPSCNVLPREEFDKGEAKLLSSIIPVILDQAGFERTYSGVTEYKLRSGTGIYGVFWDGQANGGIGDIKIKKVDALNLYWQSGITDIQDSRNLFHVDFMDNDLLEQMFPQLYGKLGGDTIAPARYEYDDTVDVTDKSCVVDWYYKSYENGKEVLHYCKYVNDEVLFATENEPETYPNGFYEHGKYPFVFDVLFPLEGTPCGFGYIDVGKQPQETIDRLNQAILKNALVNAKPRFLVSASGGINEEEYADINKEIIHVQGPLDERNVRPVEQSGLSSIYLEVLNSKIDELKETTGNRDVSNGGTTGGVTAASGLAAMMEASSRLSRRDNKSAYRAFKEVCVLVIELIRQFYSLPRQFRIVGENGAQEFIRYTNQGMLPVTTTDINGKEQYRIPLFDVEVSAEKQSPYSRLSQNELALQFYGAGFFNPALADQALCALDMMDFPRKDFVTQKIAQNGLVYKQMTAMQMAAPAITGEQVTSSKSTQALGGEATSEPAVTKNARQRVAQSTAPV